MSKAAIKPGVYLVIDPSMELKELLTKLEMALGAGIAAVQIWDNFSGQTAGKTIEAITELCQTHKTPVLINNRAEYLERYRLDGIHFDEVPEKTVLENIHPDMVLGLTTNNDLNTIEWAQKHLFDYISFCSIFPSSTANSCDLVDFDSIKKARSIFKGPIFLAGGIRPDNIKKLQSLDFDGVAVVSGIMSAEKPSEAIKAYQKNLETL